jgi:hypothetical protein
MTDKVIQAKKAMQMNEYSKARHKIGQYNKEVTQKGLDVPKADIITLPNYFNGIRNKLGI